MEVDEAPGRTSTVNDDGQDVSSALLSVDSDVKYKLYGRRWGMLGIVMMLQICNAMIWITVRWWTRHTLAPPPDVPKLARGKLAHVS
jgi:hypothetical protein